MDEHEYAKFRAKLDDRFPESASEPARMSKDLLASLPKVGRVELFRDTLPAGTLMHPPANFVPELGIRVPKQQGGDEVFINPRGIAVRRATRPRRSTAGPGRRRTPAAIGRRTRARPPGPRCTSSGSRRAIVLVVDRPSRLDYRRVAPVRVDASSNLSSS